MATGLTAFLGPDGYRSRPPGKRNRQLTARARPLKRTGDALVTPDAYARGP